MDKNYIVKDAEVIKLDTLCSLQGDNLISIKTSSKVFDIYTRQNVDWVESLSLALLNNIDLLPQPAFKIIGKKRYIVDDVSHTEKLKIKDVECWPEFGNTFHIRWNGSVEYVESNGINYFLLGSDSNHYHWLLNFLPRLLFTDRFDYLLSSKKIMLVVANSLTKNQLEILKIFGFDRDRLFFTSSDKVYNFEKLWVPSFFHGRYFSETVFQWYQSKICVELPRSSRYILSRSSGLGNSPRRRIVNHDEVVSALEPLGFVCVDLAECTMLEQMEIFAKAQFVVGPHGAGFANIVFAREKLKAIIFENSWAHTFLNDLLIAAGHISEIMICKDFFDSEWEMKTAKDESHLREIKRNRDMIVNIPDLIDTIHRLDRIE